MRNLSFTKLTVSLFRLALVFSLALLSGCTDKQPRRACIDLWYR